MNVGVGIIQTGQPGDARHTARPPNYLIKVYPHFIRL
jgi:hypothetical protein